MSICKFEVLCNLGLVSLMNFVQGDPTYLVVENDRTLATYGINAVCTHLGCVVPWNKAENKFMCPCHGSQYNNQGKVVRGPAPLVCWMNIIISVSFLFYLSSVMLCSVEVGVKSLSCSK